MQKYSVQVLKTFEKLSDVPEEGRDLWNFKFRSLPFSTMWGTSLHWSWCKTKEKQEQKKGELRICTSFSIQVSKNIYLSFTMQCHLEIPEYLWTAFCTVRDSEELELWYPVPNLRGPVPTLIYPALKPDNSALTQVFLHSAALHYVKYQCGCTCNAAQLTVTPSSANEDQSNLISSIIIHLDITYSRKKMKKTF